ncbi:MAG: hypothetical protein IKT52_13710 [Oscillospiraceae bacterium]|nr:hypothetical protein [Oscillospiraceae bacterium]
MSVYNPETNAIEDKECLVGVERPHSEDNLEIAKTDAYNGEPDIYDDGQPEPSPVENSVWDELDAAYTSGYEEGYTEGVNTAYDQ